MGKVKFFPSLILHRIKEKKKPSLGKIFLIFLEYLQNIIFIGKDKQVMFNQSFLFLCILLAIGLLAKNQSLTIAVLVLLLVKWTPLDEKLFPYLQQKGINFGVTIITIAVLVPIASGEIGFRQLTEAIKSYYAWIALASGIAVALLAKGGLSLLASDPHITTALVLGTVIAVALFNGVAVGPLVGAGIAYMVLHVVQILK